MVHLFGGFGPGFPELLSAFAGQVTGPRRVALLLQGGAGWEAYLPAYLQPLAHHGITRVDPVVPAPEGLEGETVWEQRVCNALSAADAVWIGGGQTEVYHRLYVRPPVRTALDALVRQGVPVAGLSAGAILLAERMGWFPGLSLVPHFEESGALGRLAGEVSLRDGWGIGLESGTSLSGLPGGAWSLSGQGDCWRLSVSGPGSFGLERWSAPGPVGALIPLVFPA